MVRSYPRYGATEAFGIVVSSGSNSYFDGRNAYVAALEDVLVWDVKKGEMVAMWHAPGVTALVTQISKCPASKDLFAVGYEDGSIRMWSSTKRTVDATFNGHNGAVTAFAWDGDARLASGSRDTAIIVWDLYAQEGLFRLSGHRDQVTQLEFIDRAGSKYLVSSSKDKFLKLFNLTTQHAVDTAVGHQGEIWDFVIHRGIILSGSNDGDVRCWEINDDALETSNGRVLTCIDSLALDKTSHGIAGMQLHPSLDLLALHTRDKVVNVLHFLTDKQVSRKIARRRKRHHGKKGSDDMFDGNDGADEDVLSYKDKWSPFTVVRARGKISAFSWAPLSKRSIESVPFLVGTTLNALNVYAIQRDLESPPDNDESAPLSFSVELAGHRHDVRTLCLSSDDSLLATASQGQLKVWNVASRKCIRTLDTEYALCSTFLPGDMHILVGTKDGLLLLYDLQTASLLGTFNAHTQALWSLSLRPDNHGLITGGADKQVKFWDFATKKSQAGSRTLTLKHTKTLQMSDDVLSVAYTPDQRLIAVALLDSTVRVYFSDTLKFFLSLYGHKLPVLSLSISYDSKLIVTCSADKNIKIWGLEYGDCHKSIFAHDDSVMQVCFEPTTHFFWSVGKDRMVKHWDADKFECIQKLPGHQAEVWALAVSSTGALVVTASHDKSIRFWEATDEPLFLDEERERELDALFDDQPLKAADGEEDPDAPTNISKPNQDSLMAGERIIEALDIAHQELKNVADYETRLAHTPEPLKAQVPKPPPHAVFQFEPGLSPSAYVMRTLVSIPAASLYDALLVLPLSYVVLLIEHSVEWISTKTNVSLVTRVVFFLTRTHHAQLVATRTLRPVLIKVREALHTALREDKDLVGYNLAALSLAKKYVHYAKTADFFEGAKETEPLRKRKATLTS